MAYPKIQGSIISRIIVVLLGVSLIVALYIPTQIWSEEEGEEAECRFRMEALHYAQTAYFVSNEQYADSISQIMSFAEANPAYVLVVDSMAVIVSREDTSDRNKRDAPLRPYWNVPITMDSLYRCPSHGSFYKIIPGEEGRYTIECPEVEESVKLYTFFEKSYFNHGWVDHNRTASWK